MLRNILTINKLTHCVYFRASGHFRSEELQATWNLLEFSSMIVEINAGANKFHSMFREQQSFMSWSRQRERASGKALIDSSSTSY